MPHSVPATLLAVCAVFPGVACSGPRAPENIVSKPRAPQPITQAAAPSHAWPPVPVPRDLAFLLIGGGADPLSNQVSLAQDAQFAQSVLAGRGLTLFASGPRTLLALVGERPAGALSLRDHLAGLFGVPGAESLHYEPADLAIDAPATREQTLTALKAALAREAGPSPLLVYATCHGDRGSTARDSALSLWGGAALTAAELGQALDDDASSRPARFVVTSCYGGGFAELIFRGADAARGLGAPDRCGLFAAPWDDEASGCDPNPDRRAQESYGIHFFHALRGQDRDQRPRLREIDVDGDGAVGLLEAHTWARIHAASFDVPTSTSERYLREVAPKRVRGRSDPLAAPEEVLVVRGLGAELGIDSEAVAVQALAEADRALTEASAAVEQAQTEEEAAYRALRIGLLERWPLLDHPWEERTQRLLAAEPPELRSMLIDSPLAKAQRAARQGLEAAGAAHDALRVTRARVLRLRRAFETLRLASGLKQRGGAAWASYQRIRSCERWVPPLR